jgi:Mn2+/Fe2+ NRAMP family transporter
MKFVIKLVLVLMIFGATILLIMLGSKLGGYEGYPNPVMNICLVIFAAIAYMIMRFNPRKPSDRDNFKV